ncbi:MAG: hypothetical protein OXG91_12280 [bacterium]|nr:hypothetical protein [bacterium]MCY3923906.1 hypothetical protein [bacterium]
MPLSPRRQALIAAAVATAGVASIAAAALVRDGDSGPAVDSRVEELIPDPASDVLAQHAVGLDLTDSPRYVIELFLNGQRLPDAETLQAASTNRAVYQPGAERTVEKLRAGQNCARAVFYPLAEGSASARRGEVRWCFRAA